LDTSSVGGGVEVELKVDVGGKKEVLFAKGREGKKSI